MGDEDYGGALEWIIFYYLKEEKTKIKSLLNSVSLYAFDDTFVPLFLPACLHRQNLSLHYQHDIKKTSDENKQKYQLGDQ